MKIEAYKSNSGSLFETEKEMLADDLKNDIIKFFGEKTEYSLHDVFRPIIINELCEKIIDNPREFIEIIGKYFKSAL